MHPICLLVAGVVRATLPDSEFTLAWEHSVQKTRWEERYHAVRGGLVLDEARVQGTGAGMEPPPDAVHEDGWWTWRPQSRFAELRLTRSGFASDYAICERGRCSDLGALLGPGDVDGVVVIRACDDGSHKVGSGASFRPGQPARESQRRL